MVAIKMRKKMMQQQNSASCETIVAGDINGDCKVDFKDFALMAFHWLEKH